MVNSYLMLILCIGIPVVFAMLVLILDKTNQINGKKTIMLKVASIALIVSGLFAFNWNADNQQEKVLRKMDLFEEMKGDYLIYQPAQNGEDDIFTVTEDGEDHLYSVIYDDDVSQILSIERIKD
ncbi:hypothetical protein [Terribacillus saccharophilus]|uniref:hypothetical protein n=1 Tax=Terribacillus saccharophilus TaxID=361277 RepID=UPI002989A25C|nr:hypothetical protein [Terribacillus saccharophilus]MCM3227544.1 hypothetical protein [Terribacillus saccharophilus]